MWFRDNWYKFFQSVQKSVNIEFNYDSWNKALKLNEEKNYVESFWEIMKYADSKVKRFETSDRVLKIPHGSIFLDIDFSGENIFIKSDFLDVSEANKVPLFRRITELAFSALNLTKIFLEDEKLYFTFSCPLELYDPYKIFDVLAEICYFADKYDEEFCQSFWAKQLVSPEIIEISIDKKEIIFSNFRKIIESNFEIIKDLEDRRRNNYAWDVISTTYKMIDYSCSPKWTLALKISEKVNELYNRDETLETIIFRWKEFLKELLEMSKEEFFDSIYEVKEFIPNRKVATTDLVLEYLKPGEQDAYKDLQMWDFESAYLIYMHILYNSMYYHIMPSKTQNEIVKIIKNNSNISLNKESVWKLATSLNSFLNWQNNSSEKKWILGFIWWITIWAVLSMLGF